MIHEPHDGDDRVGHEGSDGVNNGRDPEHGFGEPAGNLAALAPGDRAGKLALRSQGKESADRDQDAGD